MQQLTEKQPWEEYYIQFDFSNEFADRGDTSISIESILVEDIESGADVTATLCDSSKSLAAGLGGFVWVMGGDDRKRYKITCRVSGDQSGEKYELEGLLPVRER